LPVEFSLEGRQVGEENCPACNGTGTTRGRQHLIRNRELGKQKGIPKMTLADLDQKIREYAFDGEVKIQIAFNGCEEWDGYEGCEWLGDADRDKAFREDSVWTIRIFGTWRSHLTNSLHLGASSLPLLMQSLARYDLEPAPPEVAKSA
jgi:hypothetical protein